MNPVPFLDGIFFSFKPTMAQAKKYHIIIIGGGLAGLTTALHLARKNLSVCLVEKNTYPHHKVCGEYVSNEILPYIKSLGIDPISVGAQQISRFKITDERGAVISANLPLGGFGISRYAFDNLFYKAIVNQVAILFDTVEKVDFDGTHFSITTQKKEALEAEYVVGAFGKRSNIDAFLNRKFMRQKSPWLGVKAHYQMDFPDDTVALHNFKGGYCGLSKTETGSVNACYLATFKAFKKYGDLEIFQKKVLAKNRHLEAFYRHARPLFKRPLTISQISFQEKRPVEKHIFMVGDSAGLIHPLCGNGMAMAIRSAQIFSEMFLENFEKGTMNREAMEQQYTAQWHHEFNERLKAGRLIQRLLMSPYASKAGFLLAKTFPSIVPRLIEKTHGNLNS